MIGVAGTGTIAGAGVGAGVGTAVGATVGIGVGTGVGTGPASTFTASGPSLFPTRATTAAFFSGSRSACVHAPYRLSISTKRLSVVSASSFRPAAAWASARRDSPSTSSTGWSRKPKLAIRKSSIAS